MTSHTERTVARLARLYPWPVDASDALGASVRTLGWSLPPEAVVRAGYVVGVLVTAVTAVCVLALVGSVATPVSLLGGLLAVHIVHTTPHVSAQLRTTAALGDAPALVSRAVLRMRLTPTPEQAAVFAAEAGDGLLAVRLGEHVRRAEHTGESALDRFGVAWREEFPPLARAVTLVGAASRVPAAERPQVLERALETVLEGTREGMRAFAAGIRGPTTALYAFGVLLPTALVALLPAAGAAGVGVTPLSVVFGYNLLLPAILVGAAGWMLSQRPVAFPPPDVSAHPDADPARGALLAGPLVGIAAWLTTAQALPAWGPPVAAIGLGSGVTLWLYYRPVVAVYDEIRVAERELPGALSLVGRRVADGRAVETAIAETAPELDGPMKPVFADCVRRQRQLQVGVHEALFGQHGALSRLPSQQIRGSMALLAVAAHEGRPAGEALLTLADHVDSVRRIQRDVHHDLAYICRTLSSTAMLFGPLVAGATVALAEGMTGETFGGDAVSLAWLGGPVGLYVLVLAVVLTALATGLRRGLDRPLVCYRIGRALTGGTLSYLCAFVLVRLLA